jgi:hypothetical protein
MITTPADIHHTYRQSPIKIAVIVTVIDVVSLLPVLIGPLIVFAVEVST